MGEELDLKTALQLSIQQYTIRAEGVDHHSQTKNYALSSMIGDLEKRGALNKGLPWKYPVHECFICQYVKDRYGVDPGYDDVADVTYVVDPVYDRVAWCALFCPMRGYLWGWRGCMGDDSSYRKYIECSNYKEGRVYIKEMLLGFENMLAKIEKDEQENGHVE